MKIDCSIESRSVKMINLGPNYEICLHLFDQNYEIFTVMSEKMS